MCVGTDSADTQGHLVVFMEVQGKGRPPEGGVGGRSRWGYLSGWWLL